MMDMRAEKDLAPEDPFEFMVFGGILGNHPPEDRAKDLRCKHSHVRKLGTV